MPDNGSNQTGNATMQNGVVAINRIAQALGQLQPFTGATSGTATAGAATLPANPAGFISATLADGTSVRIPYYLP